MSRIGLRQWDWTSTTRTSATVLAAVVTDASWVGWARPLSLVQPLWEATLSNPLPPGRWSQPEMLVPALVRLRAPSRALPSPTIRTSSASVALIRADTMVVQQSVRSIVPESLPRVCIVAAPLASPFMMSMKHDSDFQLCVGVPRRAWPTLSVASEWSYVYRGDNNLISNYTRPRDEKDENARRPSSRLARGDRRRPAWWTAGAPRARRDRPADLRPRATRGGPAESEERARARTHTAGR